MIRRPPRSTQSRSSAASDVYKRQGLVLVEFWAAWSGSCRMFAPVVEQIAREYENKIKVAKLDVCNNPLTADRYNIMSLPTVILFKKGKKVAQFIGCHTKNHLAQIIEMYL